MRKRGRKWGRDPRKRVEEERRKWREGRRKVEKRCEKKIKREMQKKSRDKLERGMEVYLLLIVKQINSIILLYFLPIEIIYKLF